MLSLVATTVAVFALSLLGTTNAAPLEKRADLKPVITTDVSPMPFT